MMARTFAAPRVARCAALFCLATCAILLAATDAAAHEFRTFGPNGEYKMVVGWRYEPPYAGVHNAIDVYVTRTEDDKAIDANDGDTVDLEIELQVREAEARDAKILHSAALRDKPSLEPRVTNRYSSWVTPTKVGPYGVRIRGVVDDADDEIGPVEIDETFVCGAGRLHGETQFSCILERQEFPAPEDGGQE